MRYIICFSLGFKKARVKAIYLLLVSYMLIIVNITKFTLNLKNIDLQWQLISNLNKNETQSSENISVLLYLSEE